MYSICIASIWHHHMWGMLHLNAFDAKEPGHANDVSIKQGSSVAILRWTRYERDRLSASFSREFAPRNFTLMAWSQTRRDRRSLPKVFVAGFFVQLSSWLDLLSAVSKISSPFPHMIPHLGLSRHGVVARESLLAFGYISGIHNSNEPDSTTRE